MDEYLIIGIDSEYNEPVGVFKGNLIDILYDKICTDENNEESAQRYEIYRLDSLKVCSDERTVSLSKDIKVSSIDKLSIDHHLNKEFLKGEILEFNERNPNIKVSIADEGRITFENTLYKIKNEIYNLSPETIEYIKSYGL